MTHKTKVHAHRTVYTKEKPLKSIVKHGHHNLKGYYVKVSSGY